MQIENKVRLKQPVVEGIIAETRYNATALELEHRVVYTGADGEDHNVWFLESRLEEVAA